jgi:site-specific recombinase XerD
MATTETMPSTNRPISATRAVVQEQIPAKVFPGISDWDLTDRRIGFLRTEGGYLSASLYSSPCVHDLRPTIAPRLHHVGIDNEICQTLLAHAELEPAENYSN